MSRFALFLKHLKRFFPFFFQKLKKKIKISQDFLELIGILLGLIILICLCFAICAGVLALIILFSKTLSFNVDFTLNNISFVVAALMTCTSIGIMICMITLSSFRFVRFCWEQTSTRSIAKNLWE